MSVSVWRFKRSKDAQDFVAVPDVAGLLSGGASITSVAGVSRLQFYINEFSPNLTLGSEFFTW